MPRARSLSPEAKYSATLERVARAVRPLSTMPEGDLSIILKRGLERIELSKRLHYERASEKAARQVPELCRRRLESFE